MTMSTQIDYGTLSYAELKALAKKHGIKLFQKGRQEITAELAEMGVEPPKVKKAAPKRRAYDEVEWQVRQVNPHPSCAFSVFVGGVEIAKFLTQYRSEGGWKRIDGERHANIFADALREQGHSCKVCSVM